MKLEEILRQVIAEGVYDPNIFKAIFVVGSPGAGKSYMIDKLGLTSYGLKLVDSDVAFTHVLKKVNGDNLKLDTIPSSIRDSIRTDAIDITDRIEMQYAEGRLGLIIAGTAADIEKVKSKRDQLVELGYDTYIVFVNTTLEVYLARNRKRERSIPEDVVIDKWNRYNVNSNKLVGIFGVDHWIGIDNSTTDDETINYADKIIRKWMHSELGYNAKNWIRTQIKNKNRK